MKKPYPYFKTIVNSVLLICLLVIGCSQTVTAQCNASVTITSLQNPSCFESGANIQAQVLNAGANPVYTWYANNTPIQSGAGDSIFGYDFNVDTTMVYCTITTSAPCPVNTVSSNTITQVSLPYLTPSAVFHTTRNGICIGDTAVFSVTEINLGINPKLTWTFDGNVIDSTDTIVRVPITSYNDNISVLIYDNYACNLYGNLAAVSGGQSYFNVAAYVTPSVSIINYPATSPACPGTSYTFDAIVTDLNNPNNYFNYNLKWLINGAVVQGQTGFSFQTSSLNNGDVVTAVVTSLASCNTVDTAISNAFVAQIYAYGNPTVTFNHPAADTICHGTNVPLSVQVRDTVTNHAPETYAYEWVVNDGNPQAYDSAYDPTTTFYFQSSGSNEVFVFVRASGCYPGSTEAYLTSDTDTIVSETVYNITGAYIYGINTVCTGSAGTFFAEVNTGPNPIYEWYLDGRVVQYGPSSTFTCDTLKNNDVVTATIISTQKCNVIDSLQLNSLSITVLPIVYPTISLSTPNHICGSGGANSTGYGEVLASVSNGGPDPTYYWYVNGNYSGYSIQPGYYFSTLNSGDIVTAQFYSTCSSPDPVISAPDIISVLPWVYPSVTLAPAGNPGPNSICDNDPLIVVAHPVNGGPAPQYTWYPYGSAPVTTYSDTFYYTGNTNGYIYCYMNSDAVCAAQPSVGSGDLDAGNYYSQPSGPLYSPYAYIANVGDVFYSASVCQGSYVQLISSYTIVGSNAVKALFEDSCGGIPIFTTTSNSLSYQLNTDSPGTHIYYVRTQSPCDTSACVSFTLTVNPAPSTPVINVNNISCSNVILTTAGYAGASYQWGLTPDNNPGYNQSVTNQDSAFVATLSGSYSVTVANSYGCSSSSLPVEVGVHNFVTIDSTNFTANGTVSVSSNPSSPSPNIDMDGYNFDTEASIWYNDSISLNRDFSISFYLTGYDYSNGISFVLQDSSVGALDISENYNDDGYYGDSVFAHSLAVTLDYNEAVNNAPSVAIAENSGTVLAGPAAFANSWQFSSGYSLLYNITWEHNSRTLTAYLNGASVVSYTGDVVDSIFGGNPFVHFGLSAPGFQDYIDHYVQINYLSTQPYLTHSGGTTFCAGDSVILTCSKGPQYLWSTGDTTQSITVKATGLYSATVTDWGGCSESTDTVAVTVNPLPNVVGHVSADSICQGTAQVLTGSGAVTYQWDNGVADGDTFIQTIHRPRGDSRVFYYTVTGTDANGCSNSNTDSVTIFFTPDVFANTSADAVCPGTAVTLYGTSDWSDITYAWSNGVTDNVAFVPTTTSNYMVTATTSFGCWDTASVFVAVRSGPAVTANATLTALCAGTADTLTGGGAVSYVWDNGITDSVPFIPLTTTTYTVTGTDSNGCTAIASVTVIVNPLPNVVGHVSADSICQGTAQVLTGSGAVTYQWDNGVADGDTFIQIIRRPRGDSRVFYYTVTGTDANGCSNSNTDSVTIFFTPDVFANTSADTVCPGTAVTLYGTSDWSDITYAWSNGVTDNVAFVPTTTSNYMVTATTSFGCWDTASVLVAVRPAPAVTANATSTALCAGTADTLTGGGAVSYVWDNGITDSVPFIPLTTTTYTVTGTDSNGCTAIASVTVIVNPLPNVVGHVSADSICQGTAQVLTGSGAVTYQWDNGVADGDTFIQRIRRPRGDSRVFYYTVTGTDANGCSNSNTDSVTIFFTPDVFANTSADAVCPGTAVTLYGTSDWSDITYAWSNGVTDNVAFVPTTTSNYMVTATTSFGCWDTASVLVAVRSGPAVTANATLTALCAGTADTLTGGGAVSYVWDNGITDSVPFIPLTTTTYTVTGTDGNGCTATASVSVSINNVPVVGFTGNSTGCGLVSLTATGGTSYTWSGGNSPATAANTFATGGTYYVTAFNSSGCSASGSINVTVNANPVVAFNGSSTGCGSVALTATGGTSYSWSGGTTPTTAANTFAAGGTYTVTVSSNGCSSTASTTVTVNTIPTAGITGITTGCGSVALAATGGTTYAWSGGSMPSTAADTFTSGGNYTVTVSSNGCSSTASALVTVNQNTSAGITGAPTGCGLVSLTATGGTSYLWSGGNSPHTPGNTFISSGTYTVTVTNASGCSATVSALVTVNLNPVAGISGTATACGSVSLTASGGTSYLWSGGSSINTATNTFTSSGNYTVTVTNANGCHATASKAVTVNPNPVAGISGNATGCVSVSLTATGGTSYKWSGGSSIHTAANTFTSSGTYTVSVTGSNGCSSATSQVVTVSPKPVAGITGSTTGCFSVSLMATGGSTYLWSGGSSLHTANNSFANSGNYSVTVTNAGGCSSTASATVTINSLPGTPVFNGDAGDNLTFGVCGGGNYEYQINQIGNATSYTWTAPAGCIITDGRGHSGNPLTFNGLNVSGEYEVSISFPSGFVSGTVSVFGTNACGQGPTTNLAVQSVPNAPGAITGPTNGVCHATNQVYSIASVPGATSYTWTVPTGVSITSNSGTSIHVSFGNGFTGTGNISVKASNGCGSSTATLLPVSASPLQPGVISGNTNACKLVTSAVYSISPIAGATAYNWTITGGATFTGSTSGNSVTVNFAHAAGTVSLSVKAINICASSQSSTLSITVLNNCSGKMDESASPNDDTTVISSLQLKVYPNPTSGHLYVDFAALDNQKFTFFITDLLGNQIITENYTALAGENRKEFDLGHLAKGVYIIKAMDEGTEQKALKIVVQ